MSPNPLPLEPFTQGDQWEGLPSVAGTPFFTLQINGLAPASPLAAVTMRFAPKDHPKNVSSVELSSADPLQIHIDSTANWQFSIPPQFIPGLTFGEWRWNIRTTDAAGAKRTWLADTLSVLETV